MKRTRQLLNKNLNDLSQKPIQSPLLNTIDFNISQKIKKDQKSQLLEKFQTEKKDIIDRLGDNMQQRREKLEQEALKSGKLTVAQKKMADEFFGMEENLKRREELLREAGREGYYDNAKEVARKGAKLWEAPDKLRPAALSPKLPEFNGKWMDGSTQTLQERVYANKATLVCFVFNQFGEKHVKSFIDPFLDEFKDKKDINVIEININEQLVKAPVMKLVTPYIRWKQSKDQRARYMMLHENVYDKRHFMGMKNNALGWVNLVDSNAHVRWQAHGIATEQEILALKTLTLKL